jgi:LuxR family maltose regulon positive regulatory protein
MSDRTQTFADEGDGAEPILLTKLFVPPLRPSLVPRPALVARLDSGLQGLLTLVSAPAGFGKTTLLAEWLSQTSRPVAWLSLDVGDNDPVRFFTYLLAALEGVDPEIGQGIRPMLQAPQRFSWEPLLTSLLNDITRTLEPVILVLDDYHLIESAPVHEIVSFLVDHLPPSGRGPSTGGLHLVIVTRADPPLPIARLRARGQLAELHVADLRFGPGEARTFLNEVMGLALESGQIAALERRTEGWIAGLQLAALALQGTISMRGREDVAGFVEAFTGSHRYILDYLTEEVLNRETEERQAFLLQTSILERLCGPLCDAVRFGFVEPPSSSSRTAVRFGTDDITLQGDRHIPVDSQAILESLAAANLFIVPLDQERRWYRYHHLFADLLRQRLQRERPDLLPELHRRASQWYEANGLIPEAVSHALASDGLERAADLIEWTGWSLLIRGEVRTLRGWLDRLPDELTRYRPQLGILYAWSLALTGDGERVEPFLQGVDLEQVPGEVAAVRAYVASLHDEMSLATRLARQVFYHLPESKWFSRGMAALVLGMAPLNSGEPAAAIQALSEAIRLSQAGGRTYLAFIATTMLAEALQMQGRLHEAQGTQQQALQLAAGGSDRPAPFVGLAHVGLSRLFYEWDDLESAQREAEKGVELCRLGGLVEPLPAGLFILAQVRLARGDLDQAAWLIQETEQVAQRYENEYVLARTTGLRMRLWLADPDRVPADRWWARDLSSAEGGTAYLCELGQLARVRALLARAVAATPVDRDPVREALELLTGLLEGARAAGRVANTIEGLILQAHALQILGDGEQALGALACALDLAASGSYVRLFIDEGEPMARLLRRAVAQEIAPAYAGRLLAAYGEGAAAAARSVQTLVDQPLVDPLTDRELTVLRLIAAGLSNREIAGELVIAVSTVKTHVNRIYGKLDVKSRIQAVAKAQALDLL